MIVTQKITTLAFQLHDGKAAEAQTQTHTYALILNISFTTTEAIVLPSNDGNLLSCFSGMCKKSEQLTAEQKLVAIA